MQVGQAIQTMRVATGLRQGIVAGAIGISQGRLSQVEAGDITPSPELVARIVEVLNAHRIDRDGAYAEAHTAAREWLAGHAQEAQAR